MKLQKLFFTILTIAFFTSSIIGQHQDCDKAFPICALGTYHSDELQGFGKIKENKTRSKCSDSVEENNSFWIEWQVQESGTLLFTIDPSDPNDDIDFILYQKDKDCNSLTEIRCMASGRTYGNEKRNESNCNGSTGLQLSSTDEFELSGCKYNDDNYLKFLQAERGENYILFINNYTSTKAVSITLDGSAELEEKEGCIKDIQGNKLQISKVFPNPAQQEISILFNTKPDSEFTLEILSLRGELLHQQAHISNNIEDILKIKVDEFPSGTYVIRLKQGAYTSSKKFIKI